MPFEPVVTADGSLSCLDTETGQLCHNRAGAYSEAVNNYVQPSALAQILQDQGHIRILDACYGLGYNTWALINELAKSQITLAPSNGCTPATATVFVIGIEQSEEVLQMMPRILEHPTFDALKMKNTPLEHNTYYRTLKCICNTNWGQNSPHHFVMNVADFLRFELTLYVSDLRTTVPEVEPGFDAVFHDPFSPQKMPELWTVDLFRQYYRLLEGSRGCLLTYSSAAAIRGGLSEAGFTIGKTRGLGAKDGGTLAIAAPASSEPDPRLDNCLPMAPWEQDYLNSRAGIPYRDEGLRQSRATILAQRATEQAQSSRPSGSHALKRKPLNTR